MAFKEIVLAFLAAVLLVVFLVVISALKLKKQTASRQEAVESEWAKRNRRNECGRCASLFTKENPDFGGGMCMRCWAGRAL